jgi:hypothetical protein
MEGVDMTRARRAATRVLALGALTVLLTGCLKLTMDLEVSSEDAVSGTAVFAVSRDILELTGGSLEDVIGNDSIVPSDVEGVTVAPYEDDEFAGQEITFDAVPLEEFNQEGGEDALSIERQGDRFVVSGALDLTMDEADTEGIPFDPQQMFDEADIRITLSFPGDVESSNGDVDGNTVTWTPTVGERTQLNAVASAVDGGDSGLLLWVLVAIVALAVIAAVAIASRRRRTSPPPTASGLGSTEPGTSAAVPVPTTEGGAVASPGAPPDVVPSQPAPTEPVPPRPQPTEPVPAQPQPTEPVPAQPQPTEPVPPQPGAPPEPPPSPPAVPGQRNDPPQPPA